ncbi:DUF397 domain-containing protein [Actinocorallia sp. API 0066]|uniref:DUF397 domain-containing protein n=1 Tax=Actinocorallia sp. API 0066 TaxID=2896846 RepID=UPI001E3073F6|nr:DUF397 domain-containing protein [Actinocorallia sp. API 0066]MCD0449057.1 DUF397 domain-containing protein [Actinocorallia sp. API 0066]
MNRDWFKRSYSQGDNTDCVEAAFDGPLRLLRDSKNPHSGHLTLPASAYRTFIEGLK